MRYALIVGMLFCGSFALAGEEPTPAEPTKAAVSDCDCKDCDCGSRVCRLPRKVITRTRTVTTADACGNECSTEYSRTRYRGRIFPIFGRRWVSSRRSCSSCN